MKTTFPTAAGTRGTNSKLQAWQWFVLAVVLITIAAAAALYIGNAQAQGSRGALTGLTLTSDAPGTLTATWDAASPVPTDYRVDWAKSDEDYQSWKVDNGHVYPAADITTATITGLEHETDYKIRARARYYKGEHEENPWGGPWATATITVAGEPEPPPTPEPAEEEPVQHPPKEDPAPEDPAPKDTTPAAGTIETLTAADDTGQLLLTWTAPAAPNADPTDYHVNWGKSTEDYPADTATDGNAHPTTTTHTLAGLDYDTDYNIRVRARYTDGENANSPWNGPWTETTAQVKLPLPAAPFIGAIAVTPDGEVLLTWFNSAENDSITSYQVLRGPDADSLAVIEDDTGSNGTSYTDETPPAGQTHTYAVKARNAAGLSPLSNTVTATVPVAEPEEEEQLITLQQSSGDTLVSTISIDPTTQRFLSTGAGGVRRHAQPFRTGPNPNGYRLDSVRVLLRSNNASPSVTVDVRRGGSRPPEDSVYELTQEGLIIDALLPVTFRAPAGAQLLPSMKYWIVVQSGNTGVGETFNMTDEDQAETGWDLMGRVNYYIAGVGWHSTIDRRTKMSIHGEAIPDVLVSNLGQLDEALAVIGTNLQAAQAFVAGLDPAGFRSRFQGIRVAASSHVLSGNVFVPEVRVSLHRDVNGLPPGSRLLTLTVPHDFASTGEFMEYTLSAPPGTVIPGGSRYWVVFETLSETLLLRTTSSPDEDQVPPPVDGWLIDNERYLKDINNVWQRPPRVIEMAVLGSPEWDTDEPAGEDFPGAYFNAHETTGVVTPGTASTGHLTAGVDRNYGLTGDYWYLDTQPGRSYRVTVTFGDSPNNNTGGSAGVEFIDPDHDNYPDASGCCESDHNRDDGHTFVHFTHSRQSRGMEQPLPASRRSLRPAQHQF